MGGVSAPRLPPKFPGFIGNLGRGVTCAHAPLQLPQVRHAAGQQGPGGALTSLPGARNPNGATRNSGEWPQWQLPTPPAASSTAGAACHSGVSPGSSSKHPHVAVCQGTKPGFCAANIKKFTTKPRAGSRKEVACLWGSSLRKTCFPNNNNNNEACG